MNPSCTRSYIGTRPFPSLPEDVPSWTGIGSLCRLDPESMIKRRVSRVPIVIRSGPTVGSGRGCSRCRPSYSEYRSVHKRCKVEGPTVLVRRTRGVGPSVRPRSSTLPTPVVGWTWVGVRGTRRSGHTYDPSERALSESGLSGSQVSTAVYSSVTLREPVCLPDNSRSRCV